MTSFRGDNLGAPFSTTGNLLNGDKHGNLLTESYAAEITPTHAAPAAPQFTLIELPTEPPDKLPPETLHA